MAATTPKPDWSRIVQHLSAAFIYSIANPYAQELQQLSSMEDKLMQW